MLNAAMESKAGLALMASRKGQSVDQMIADMIEKHGTTIKVARKLSVAPNTIRYRLLKIGYRFIDGEWLKHE